jgi:D-serine dehydratase
VNLSAATHKGYPAWAAPLPASAVGAQGWHIHRPDWPLPCAVLRRDALQHNLGWMQRLVSAAGADLAPHGKTTLSPELLRAQIDAGAWGITFASVSQLAFGLAHGVRRAVIANQVVLTHDLQWLQALHRMHPGLQAPFLLDSPDQLAALEAEARRSCGTAWQPLDVLIELGLPRGRTGCRDHHTALDLARAVHASPAVRLVGIECYEGLWTQGDDAADAALVQTLMARVHRLAQDCDTLGLFQHLPEVLVTAGGSAVYDLVLAHLRPTLSRPVRALLRSGCYITHDHGFYQRLGQGVTRRLAAGAAACGSGLRAALEVWCAVQSVPEPGLAILNAGKRDLSADMGLPVPVALWPAGAEEPQAAPGHWTITQLNDQHAHLDTGPGPSGLRVGDRVVLGISHPCTTFDKWRWMPVVDGQGTVVDAITTGF